MLLALEKKNLGLFANLQKGFLIMREVRFKRFIIRYKLVETAKLNINSDSMDVRATNKTSTAQDLLKEQDEKLTDSLIYNIIKKIELKESMQAKYDQNRLPQVKDLAYGLGKYIHSANGLGYFLAAATILIYLRYRTKKNLKLTAFVPHAIIGLTLNQYDRYRGIMNFDSELTNEYRSYQANTQSIIKQMRRRVTLLEVIQNSNIITLSKIVQMLNYKPFY